MVPANFHLLDLTQFWSPVGGGTRRYLAEKTAWMRRRLPGARHTLVVPGPATRTEDDGLLRVRSLRAPLASRTAQYRALLDRAAVTQAIAAERPDLIECSDPYQLAWTATAAGRALGIPVVAYYHSHFLEAYVEPVVRRWLGTSLAAAAIGLGRRYAVRAYQRFARVLVPSPALADELRSWGLRNVVLAELGVDARRFHPAANAEPSLRAERRARLGWPADRFVLLNVGRLAPEKNARVLFDAFDSLAADERLHLAVIGDGPDAAALRRLPADRVTWHPRLPAEQLPDAYRAADLLVHPGVLETFGLVTVEAQACGLPVCGIRGTRMDQLAFGETLPLWADANAPAALAEAVQRFVALAPAARRSLGEHVAQAAARYDWDFAFEHIFRLYAETR